MISQGELEKEICELLDKVEQLQNEVGILQTCASLCKGIKLKFLHLLHEMSVK